MTLSTGQSVPVTSPPLAVVLGPTASGKSSLGMALAATRPVEIVVADSRQVYRGMDIGTAKPSPADREAVPHHLVDLVDPDQAFTLADWLAAARAVIPEIAHRGRLPLVVGGTGLYINALVDGYDLPAQPSSPELRRRLLDEMEAEGLAPMAERLRLVAPQLADATDLHNPRRVLRALERAAAGGGGAGQPRASAWPGPVAMIGLQRPRTELYRRIDERTGVMFTGGLLDEVAALTAQGFGPWLPPMTGHGYREAMRVAMGEWSLDRAVEVTARHTRQYAKRQLSWFRRDARITWIDADDGPADDPRLVAAAANEIERAVAGEASLS
jgi:tRNA dimethylallyltransferase